MCKKVTEQGLDLGPKDSAQHTRYLYSSVVLLEFEKHPFGVPSDSGEITLKICNLMPQDSGIYTCIAANDHGTTSTSATVKVQGTISLINIVYALFNIHFLIVKYM